MLYLLIISIWVGLLSIGNNFSQLFAQSVLVTETATFTNLHNLPLITPQNVSKLTKIICLFVPDENGLVQVTSPNWSPNGQILATVGSKGIWLFTIDNLEKPRLLAGQVWSILGFSRDSGYLFSLKPDGTVGSWNLQTGQEQLTLNTDLRGEQTIVNSTGTSIASWNVRADYVLLWDMATSKQSTILQNFSEAMAFSPDGMLLALGDWRNARIALYDVKSLRHIADLKHPNIVNGLKVLSFSPDGKSLAAGGSNNDIWIWDLKLRQVKFTLNADYYDGIQDIVFSPDATRLVSWGRTKMYLWDVVTGTQLAFLPGHGFDRVGAAFNPTGNLLASWDFDTNGGRVRLWNGNTGIPLKTLAGLWETKFNSDGNLIATHGDNGTVELWGVDKTQITNCTN